MERRFKGCITSSGNGIVIELPFEPNEVWGERERHHVTGTVGGCKFRGPLKGRELHLGPAWVRDNPVEGEVEVVLSPEGPQADALARDISSALDREPEAKAFFAALPTFYRKNFMRWIDQAKREETRANRISEMVGLLKEGKRER